MRWADNEALARQQFHRGHRTEAFVTSLLVAEGLGVRIRPFIIRPSFRERAGYADDGVDLYIIKPTGEERPLQVKTTKYAFTNPDDWPWQRIGDPYVCEAHKWKDIDHVIVSEPKQGVMVVPAAARRSFGVKTGTDRLRGTQCTWLRCPRRSIRTWDAYVRWLLG